MAKIVKNLSITNISKYEGFVRREDLDFKDDGNYFKGFSYKGMPITTIRSCDETYLCVRVDYLENNLFTYKEWRETEEYHLCDAFNGVSEFDIDVLVENVEKIIAKVNELNAKAKADEVDTSEVEKKLVEEIEYAESVVANFKNSFKWYDASAYELKRLVDYLKSTERQIAHAKTFDFAIMKRVQKKQFVESLRDYGYVYFKENDFYLREMNEALSK